jgi:hypothetical protein
MEFAIWCWTHLTPAQATLLAGIRTPIAAVAAVWFSGSFFKGQVITLQDAIATSSVDLDKHISKIDLYQVELAEN